MIIIAGIIIATSVIITYSALIVGKMQENARYEVQPKRPKTKINLIPTDNLSFEISEELNANSTDTQKKN